MQRHDRPPLIVPQPGSTLQLMGTCLCDAFYGEVALAAADCLEYCGYGVEFRPDQTCCSQPAFNSGDWPNARKVARHVLDLYGDEDSVVVVPSGSCAAMIRSGYLQMFKGEPELPRALNLASRTWEICEFLDQVAGSAPWDGRLKRRISLHRSCHLRELTTADAPERLLSGIRGLEVIDIRTPEQCCGFGGTFAVTFPWTSKEMGDARLQEFADAGVEEVVSTDMGCVMHLNGLQSETGKPGIRLRHLVELLRESL